MKEEITKILNKNLCTVDTVHHWNNPQIKGIPEAAAEIAELYKTIKYENNLLRVLLWLRHGCKTFGSDSQMKCDKCGIDFEKDDPRGIKQVFESQDLKSFQIQETGKRKKRPGQISEGIALKLILKAVLVILQYLAEYKHQSFFSDNIKEIETYLEKVK